MVAKLQTWPNPAKVPARLAGKSTSFPRQTVGLGATQTIISCHLRHHSHFLGAEQRSASSVGSCVRPSKKRFFTDFACKFDTGILAVNSNIVFDKFTDSFSRTSVCRGNFLFSFFETLSLPFSLPW